MSETTVRAIERQQRWEMDGIAEGVKRYQRQIAGADVVDTPPGQKAMNDAMKSLIPALKLAQEEAFNGIQRGRDSGPANWWWLITLLSPEKLAFITVRSILQCPLVDNHSGRPESRIVLHIGQSVRQQVEWEIWQQREKAKEKETDGEYQSPLRWAIHHAKQNVNLYTFQKWARKLDGVEKVEWTRTQKMQVGAKLLREAVENGGGWFEVRTATKYGKTYRNVHLSEVAIEALADISSRMEVSRPLLTPMRCPPKPWQRNVAE